MSVGLFQLVLDEQFSVISNLFLVQLLLEITK